MRPETPSTKAIFERLEKLERQNRAIKGVAVASLAALGMLVLMGQSKRPGPVEASAFIVRDSTGEVRAKLAMDEGNAELKMFDQQGRETAAVDSIGSIFLFTHDSSSKATILSGRELTFLKGYSLLSYLNSEALGLHVTHDRETAGIRAVDDVGQVHVSDTKGFMAVLGRMPLENTAEGSSETTSAASLILFNQKNEVIWRAP